MAKKWTRLQNIIADKIVSPDGGSPTIGNQSEAEQELLNGVTAGTVTASKAVVVDSNKDIGDFRNIDVVNLDAGSSGVAGSVDVFPTTASKGKLTITCADQTGDTAVVVNANAMGQATTVNLSDPGAAASYLAQSTAALTLAEMDVLDGASAASPVPNKAVIYDANGDIRAGANLGTPNTGVTAVEFGDGFTHTTRLTVSQADAVTIADNGPLADGYLVYTFPAGAIVISSAYMSMALSVASTEAQSDTPDVGIGTTIGSGGSATLNLVDAAAENIITGQTAADSNGAATVKTIADQHLVIEAADDHTVYFNIADTWANDTGGDLTGDISGTIVLNWSFMA